MQTRDPSEITGATVAIPRPPPADPLIGRMLGSYRVVKLLGRGGMGAVYLGEHPSIGSKVAIKVLHPRFADDPGILDRFFNEARAVNLIGHDNIVRVLDFNSAGDVTYLVMEWLAGPTLETALKKVRVMPLSRAGPIVLQCCRALQAAHDHKIVHRDLKPDNVFLVRQGDRGDFVKLVDFGIAKLQDAGVLKTQAGTVLGTPAYMSPEQAQAQQVDARTDIYSMGVMMYLMATGRLPFAHLSQSLPSQLHAAVHEEPPRPRTIAPETPEEYEEIILRAMHKDRAARFQSMAELHDAVFSCLEAQGLDTDLPRAGGLETAEHGGGHGTPTPARRTTHPPRRSTKRLFAILAGATAGVVAAGGIALGLRAVAERREQTAAAERLRARQRAERERAAREEREAEERREAEAEGQRQAEEAERARLAEQERVRQAEEAERAAAKRAAQKKAAVPAETVRLFLVSNPQAHYLARWKGGWREGETPMQLEVPKGARVTIRYTREGYKPFEIGVNASEPQAIPGSLPPE